MQAGEGVGPGLSIDGKAEASGCQPCELHTKSPSHGLSGVRNGSHARV